MCNKQFFFNMIENFVVYLEVWGTVRLRVLNIYYLWKLRKWLQNQTPKWTAKQILCILSKQFYFKYIRFTFLEKKTNIKRFWGNNNYFCFFVRQVSITVSSRKKSDRCSLDFTITSMYCLEVWNKCYWTINANYNKEN